MQKKFLIFYIFDENSLYSLNTMKDRNIVLIKLLHCRSNGAVEYHESIHSKRMKIPQVENFTNVRIHNGKQKRIYLRVEQTISKKLEMTKGTSSQNSLRFALTGGYNLLIPLIRMKIARIFTSSRQKLEFIIVQSLCIPSS